MEVPNNKMFEIGVDIENVERFTDKTLEKDEQFLKAIFTEAELQYCFSNGKTAQHLCGKFCAKEAFIKAISSSNLNFKLNEIEILNEINGKPYFNLSSKYHNIDCKLSISHTSKNAIAYVIVSNSYKNKGIYRND